MSVEKIDENLSSTLQQHENDAHEMRRSHLGFVSRTNEVDAEQRYKVEAEDDDHEHTLHTSRHASSLTLATEMPQKTTISWEENDKQNPYNWSGRKKGYIVFMGVLSCLNSTIGSALPSNAIPFIVEDFGITDPIQNVLPISVFLIGYVCAPIVYSPLSETYGRRTIYTATFLTFTIFTLACALAPSWGALNAFRFICGLAASAPVVLVGGIYADIYNNPVARGRAMALFMAATGIGPLLAPVISGFASPALGWRWTFWIGFIIAVVSAIPVCLTPETYGPIILARRAQKLRRSGNNPNIYGAMELEKKGFKQMATVILTRPIRMLCFEAIVASSSAYCAVCYATFYMLFEAYPIIFQGIYHFSPGVSGLMFLPIGAGQILGMFIFMFYDGYFARARAASRPWAQAEEARRLPLACLGGPLLAISMFWLGWSARESIPWVVPFLAGVPFGCGFVLIFMALLNYLTDAYQIFAASALAASSSTRSVFGAVLPFAATPMYERLGVGWASSILGFISLALCAIPFLFLRYGGVIRERSKFCTYLREMAEEKERALNGVGMIAVETDHEMKENEKT